jgi:S-formylglutathione hydrolase FrmB
MLFFWCGGYALVACHSILKETRRVVPHRTLLDAGQDQLAYWKYQSQIHLHALTERRHEAELEAIEASPFDQRALIVRWFSPELGASKRFHIYLPPGYAGSSECYPVLYLLRGHEREWLNVNEDTSREGKNALDVYERLLIEGLVGPMILVMPSLTSDDGVVHGIGTDNLAPWLAHNAPGTGTGRWESYFVQDLIPFVDAHWRTHKSGAHRGVDGFSIGGAVAVKVAAKYPGLFRTVGAYDGTFFFTEEDGSTVRADDPVLRSAIFDPAFGRERDLAHLTANSPVNLILHGDPAVLQRLTWMIQYGPEQIEPWGSNFYRGEHLVAALKQRGIANALGNGVLPDGDHSWRTAGRHLALTLPIHWSILGAGSHVVSPAGATLSALDRSQP